MLFVKKKYQVDDRSGCLAGDLPLQLQAVRGSADCLVRVAVTECDEDVQKLVERNEQIKSPAL